MTDDDGEMNDATKTPAEIAASLSKAALISLHACVAGNPAGGPLTGYLATLGLCSRPAPFTAYQATHLGVAVSMAADALA